MSVLCYYFFFSSRRRHTRSDRDWSSDVCSSDLRHAQTAARASVAEEASTVCVPLHSDQFQLAELGGALVQRIERQSNQARQLRKCAGSKTSDRGIPAKLERKSEALHLDGHRRGHHDENRAGAGQDGADPARIHPAPQQEKERNSLYSYLRYTPLGDVFFHFLRSAVIARRARRRGDLEFFKEPGFFHSQIVCQQLALFFRRLTIAVNDLTQDALVDAHFASKKVLAHRASEKLQF